MKYQILNNQREIYKKMLFDIKKAKKEILLENYIYDKDSIGKEFCEELTKKAMNGIKVKILIDSLGSTVNKKFFKKLIDFGGEVRFFRRLKLAFWIIKANHERNHRKLLIIDNKISYIGSSNISKAHLNFEELVLRIEGSIAIPLKRSFLRSWSRFKISNVKKLKRIIHEGIEILEDIPDGKSGSTAKTYHKLIKGAKKNILIATPYFFPSRRFERHFKKAIKRGVKVKVIIPKISDHPSVDLFSSRNLGRLYRIGLEIYYFEPKILHSKLLIVDDFFLLGSSNLDYRSFLHQFEVNILGKNKEMIYDLRRHFDYLLKRSVPFNYERWKEKHSITRWKDNFIQWIYSFYEEYF